MNITVFASLLGCVRSAPRMPLGQLRQLIIGAYSQIILGISGTPYEYHRQ